MKFICLQFFVVALEEHLLNVVLLGVQRENPMMTKIASGMWAFWKGEVFS
jgi:hypothetical protein